MRHHTSQHNLKTNFTARAVSAFRLYAPFSGLLSLLLTIISPSAARAFSNRDFSNCPQNLLSFTKPSTTTTRLRKRLQMLTAGRLNFSSALHGAGHILHMLYIRIKHTNLPLLVVFARCVTLSPYLYSKGLTMFRSYSALFMFVRALSGAGYTYASPDALPSTLTLEQTSDTEPMLANAYAGFEDQWTRFKEALLSCPDEINDNGEADVIDVGAAPAAGDAKTRTRVGVACLGERLSGAISRSRSSVNALVFTRSIPICPGAILYLPQWWVIERPGFPSSRSTCATRNRSIYERRASADIFGD